MTLAFRMYQKLILILQIALLKFLPFLVLGANIYITALNRNWKLIISVFKY